MQGTSKATLQFVMATMKESGIGPVTLRFNDVSSLIHLLYEQENYEELERLLLSLWQSREVQRNWSTAVVLRIGSLLVEAHAREAHVDQAIELCSTMYYNVRQSRGGTHGQALDLAHRLAALLRYAGRVREAIRSSERMRAAAETHLDGMRRCGYGSGGGSAAATAVSSAPASRQRSTANLYQRLAGRYGKFGVPPIDKWEGKMPENGNGHVEFDSVSWVLHVTDNDEDLKKGHNRDSIGPAKQRWGLWGKSVGSTGRSVNIMRIALGFSV
ncbi:hypothetical protein PG987_006125 [Apiospora arundinis]